MATVVPRKLHLSPRSPIVSKHHLSTTTRRHFCPCDTSAVSDVQPSLPAYTHSETHSSDRPCRCEAFLKSRGQSCCIADSDVAPLQLWYGGETRPDLPFPSLPGFKAAICWILVSPSVLWPLCNGPPKAVQFFDSGLNANSGGRII